MAGPQVALTLYVHFANTLMLDYSTHTSDKNPSAQSRRATVPPENLFSRRESYYGEMPLLDGIPTRPYPLSSLSIPQKKELSALECAVGEKERTLQSLREVLLVLEVQETVGEQRDGVRMAEEERTNSQAQRIEGCL